MSEEIRLERTEVGGQVTLVPQGRVMYTIAEYETLKTDRDRWRKVAMMMYGNILTGNSADALSNYEEEQPWLGW